MLNPSPPQRYNATLVELPGSSQLVLTGGKTTSVSSNVREAGGAGQGLIHDCWTFSGSSQTWTALASTVTVPPAAYDAAGSYDGTYVSLVGGTDGNVNLGTTWSYSTGTGWFQQALTPAITTNGYTIPTTLRAASMARSSGAGTILFGGLRSYLRTYALETWQWTTGNPGSWALLTPATHPSGREYAAMAGSPTKIIMFGGKNFTGALNDVWSFSGGTWTQLTTTNTPPALYGASLTYDSTTSLFVLAFGVGLDGRYSKNIYVLNPTTLVWTTVTPSNSVPLGFVASAFSTAAGLNVYFGGVDSYTDYQNTMTFNSTTNALVFK